MDPEKLCETCKGKKVAKESKKVRVEIDKGAPDGEQYVKHGEGHEVPDGKEAGDAIVVVKVKKHEKFSRRGADLFMEKEVSLLEALTGVNFVFEHLDGRQVRIVNKPGDIVKHDSLFTAEGLGMPFHKKSYQYGNLILQFKLRFPEQLDPKQVALIQEALGSKP